MDLLVDLTTSGYSGSLITRIDPELLRNTLSGRKHPTLPSWTRGGKRVYCYSNTPGVITEDKGFWEEKEQFSDSV